MGVPVIVCDLETSTVRRSKQVVACYALVTNETGNVAHSCNHCCCGKAVSIRITQPVCVFVGLGIQHAMRMRHILICGLSGCAILSHIISQSARFSKRKVIEHETCFDFLHNFCLKHFSFSTDVSVQPSAPTFKGQEDFWDILTLEDGTDSLSRNVGAELSFNAA